MSNLPLVSIALCTYNGEAFLREQLDSVLAQTYPNLEIIIVDDCSGDSTWEILEGYASKHQHVNIFANSENLGYTKNFEKALQLCKGELVAICDQDDVWHPEKMSMQVEALGTNLLIYHDSEFIDRFGNKIGLTISDKFNFYRGSDPAVFLLLNCISGHSILMKNTLLQASLPFPVGFHYDQWLAYVAASMGSVDFINLPLVQYRQHETNSTDILATRSRRQPRERQVKLNEMHNETAWLKICAQVSTRSDLAAKLYALSLQRNRSWMGIGYGWKIWQNRESLLFLLKKGPVSKFFFVLRKTWGERTKKLF